MMRNGTEEFRAYLAVSYGHLPYELLCGNRDMWYKLHEYRLGYISPPVYTTSWRKDSEGAT